MARTAAIGGDFATAVALVVSVLALDSHRPWLVAAAAVLMGLSFGLAFGGSLRHLGSVVPAAHRGQVMSAFYVLAYGAMAVPTILAGWAATTWAWPRCSRGSRSRWASCASSLAPSGCSVAGWPVAASWPCEHRRTLLAGDRGPALDSGMTASDLGGAAASIGPHDDEPHRSGLNNRLNWLRAAVLGANDG